MRKAAILSDIHGNLHMLLKALDICKDQGVERYIILGDMVTDGPDSLGVLEVISNLTDDVIRGNREEYMISYHKGERDIWDDNHQCESLVKTYENLNDVGLGYISSLPNVKRISLFGIDTLMVHGSHISTRHFILPSSHIDTFMDMYDRYDCSLFLLGHAHQSYCLKIKDKHFINPGPLGIPCAMKCYNRDDAFSIGIISVDEKTKNFDYENVYIQYDPDELSKYYLKNIDEYNHDFWIKLIADSFYTKFYHSLDFLRMAQNMARDEGYENYDPIPNGIWVEAAEKWIKEHKESMIF